MKNYLNINKVLSKIIEQVTEITESETISPVTSSSYVSQSFYVEKNVDQINHLLSETFFTKEYVEQIQKLLGDSNRFLLLSDDKRKLIQSELDSLSHDDYLLKTYLHKSVHEAKNLHKLFPKSFDTFKIGW